MANTYTIGNQIYNNVSYSSIGAVGSSGSVLTTSGSNGSGWVTSSVAPNTVLTVSNNKATIEETAALEVKGKMIINGLDLEERLKTIEKVLMIPERDAILEASYPLLKKKYDDYINTLSKYRMWESIKGNNDEQRKEI